MNNASKNLKTAEFEIEFEVVDERINFIAEEFVKFLGNPSEELVVDL